MKEEREMNRPGQYFTYTGLTGCGAKKMRLREDMRRGRELGGNGS